MRLFGWSSSVEQSVFNSSKILVHFFQTWSKIKELYMYILRVPLRPLMTHLYKSLLNTDDSVWYNSSWLQHSEQWRAPLQLNKKKWAWKKKNPLAYEIMYCTVYCHYLMLNKEAFRYWQLCSAWDSFNYSCLVYVQSIKAAWLRSTCAFIASLMPRWLSVAIRRLPPTFLTKSFRSVTAP